jgi:hypothetical protein
MAATRLSDGQKKELVERFRGGEGSQGLARAYGCSPATVIRAVRAALEPEEYERLKQQGGRRPASLGSAAAPAALAPCEGPAASDEPAVTEVPAVAEEPAVADEPAGAEAGDDLAGDADAADAGVEAPGVLAIDDADDFGADDFGADDEDLLAEAADEADSDDDGGEAEMFVPIAPVGSVDDHGPLRPIPFAEAQLPTCAYMLVDKTVELQARPLSDFPELGRLTPEEQQRQALVVFANPRQARRQCGRSQRVIKLPDLSLLERTSRYLLAQGISRVVIEGALYSLPGS